MRKIVEEFVKSLGSREYMNEFSNIELNWMKDNNIIAIHGYSDDNLEIVGALNDEFGAFEGIELYIYYNFMKDSFSFDDVYPEDIPHEFVAKITANYGCEWSINSDVQSLKIDIYEDGDLFSECLFIDLEDIKTSKLSKYEKELTDVLGFYKLGTDNNIYYAESKEQITSEGIWEDDFDIIPSYLWSANKYAEVIGEIMEDIDKNEMARIGYDLLASTSHLSELDQNETFIKFIINFVTKFIKGVEK